MQMDCSSRNLPSQTLSPAGKPPPLPCMQAAAGAAALINAVAKALAELASQHRPPGLSAGASAALRSSRSATRLPAGQVAGAKYWEKRVARQLLPALQEAATKLAQQQAASAGQPAEEDAALRQRLAGALAAGQECANPRCPNVRVSRLKLCTGCGQARFCGRECQRAAWALHRIVCRGGK